MRTMQTALLLLLLLAAGCGAPRDAQVSEDAAVARTEDPLTAGQQDGWRTLFDGRTTDGWRGYGRQDVPDGWEVIDGALTLTGSGGDIITTEQFADFELELEWKVAPGGNSGIFYRAIESSDPIYFSAPEMQVLDDAGHADGQSRITAAGSNFGLHEVPAGVVRPADEWNAVRLVVNGNHVEHWLNGTKVVEYELGSEDWKRRVADSKFAAWSAYGTAARGHIGLQDHGDRVAFRNIRIRTLP